MAFRDGPFENLKVPLGLTAGFAVIVAGAVAVLFLIGDRRDPLKGEGYAAVRGVFERVAAPANGVFAAPVRWVGDGSDWISDYFDAVNENRRLKTRLARLEAVRDNNIALQNINRRYEALLNIRIQPAVAMATARTVAESRGPFANARLIDAGSEKGIRVGNPVINEQGLVGRIVGVTNSVSRVLLLTDVASHTPVLVDRTDARAILTGDGGANPKLEFLRGTDSVKEGDRILSSGDGGIFPRGLPVGEAARALDGSWRVKLYGERGDLDYVRVLLFQDFAQLVRPESLSAPPLASLTTAPQPGFDPSHRPPAKPVAAASLPAPAKGPVSGGKTSAASAAAQKTPAGKIASSQTGGDAGAKLSATPAKAKAAVPAAPGPRRAGGQAAAAPARGAPVAGKSARPAKPASDRAAAGGRL